jgi:hypothetical protein
MFITLYYVQRTIITVFGATAQLDVGRVVLKILNQTIGHKHPEGLL